MANDTPTRIGRYRLLERLGDGGMGIVHRAWDEELDRMVALKILRTEPSGDDETRERLLREGRAIARLHHPNVVKVHEVGLDDERFFLAMELVRGPTLRQWLDAQPRDWREVLPRMLEAGEALAAAHDAGLVHRDFKPANMLLGEDRDGVLRARVADFGLARSAGGAVELRGTATSSSTDLVGLTQLGTVIGTPAYMAPEQHLGEPAGPRADQFAFCVVLWECVHGTRPFDGASRQELVSNIARGHTDPTRRPTPRWLDRALARGLRAEPELRWPSMHALLRALRRGPVVARRRRIAIVSIAAIAIAGALGLLETLRARRSCAERAAARIADWAATQRPSSQPPMQTVVRALDQHARAIESTARESCEAGVRGEQTEDLRAAIESCLDDRVADLAAISAMLDDAELATAIDGLARLPDPLRCRGAERAGPGEVERRAHARALLVLGRFAQAEQAIAELGDDTPELHLLHGIAKAGGGDRAGAIAALREAIWAAESERSDAIGARAWVELARVVDPAAREHDAELAVHAIVRAGGDDTLAWDLALVRAEHALADGHPDDAIARLADVAARVPASVAEEVLAARTLALRGRALLAVGRNEAAASDLVQALALTSELFGADDPRTTFARAALDRV